jgi:hypothetical protein
MQSIRLSQHEYINAFSTDGWRDTVHTSVTANHDYLFPPNTDDNAGGDAEPEPEPRPPQPLQSRPAQPHQPTASSPQPPSRPQQPAAATPQPPNAAGPTPAQAEAAFSMARSLFPSRPGSTPPQPAAPAGACHPDERSEGPCLNPASSTIDENRLASAPAFDHTHRLRESPKLF